MSDNFEQLITQLSLSLTSTKVLHQINLILQQQIDQSLSAFISHSFNSILTLEHWAWQFLSDNSDQWINELDYREVFHTLAIFNKNLIYNCHSIETDRKAALIFPVTVDQINDIFKQIDQSNDDNDPFISIVNLWFDNHSHFLHENPHSNKLSITDSINQHITCNYIMNGQFKVYLTQLRHADLADSIFTAKMLFYIKTSLFSLFSYLGAKDHRCFYPADQMLRYLCDDYLHIIHVHSATVAMWNRDFLGCMGHFIGVVAKCYWLNETTGTQMNILFPTEQIACDHVRDLVDMINHKQFYKEIQAVRSNDETVLIDSVLMVLLNVVKIQNINWFFRSNAVIRETLLTVAEGSLYDEICLRAYVVMCEVLTDEQLKELKITDTMVDFFFKMLEEAWHHPSKEYKQIPIEYLLRDFRTLSKNDSIQQRTADLNKIPLLINVCDQYRTVYHILWTLSFNEEIQIQLRSDPSFMSKLSHLAEQCDNEQIRKITNGILWNLKSNHRDPAVTQVADDNTFDVMISYSHKDKVLCQQLYQALTKGGYRVWIDFDQMHGNVMDAMAQAIDRSQTIILCMSEQYRKSNYCRAEAHYAFQRQRKIVPVLMQNHYKPDGWLLFLTGQLLYVDFSKYEFEQAMDMLLEELRAGNIPNTQVSPVQRLQSTDTLLATTSECLQPIRPENILEWTEIHVQNLLIEHDLVQMSRLLANCDGRSLVYLNKYIRHGDLRQILNSLQEDALRRTNQNLSVLELSFFQSLMDQYQP